MLWFNRLVTGLSLLKSGFTARKVDVSFVGSELAVGTRVFRVSHVYIIPPLLPLSLSSRCSSYKKDKRAKPENLPKRYALSAVGGERWIGKYFHFLTYALLYECSLPI